MLQAEVGGGGRVDPEEGLQKPGYVIRDFVLPSALGVRVQISDYRGRSNLVLVFAGQMEECTNSTALLMHMEDLLPSSTLPIASARLAPFGAVRTCPAPMRY